MFDRTIFGTRLRGSLPQSFSDVLGPMAVASVKPRRRVHVSYKEVSRLPDLEVIWSESSPDNTSRFAVCQDGKGIVLTSQYHGSGLFRIDPESITVEWCSGDTAAHCLFSFAFPLWLELNGVAVLHASAVDFGNAGVAFLGRSGAGKSSLAAALALRGAHLIADDGLPVEAVGGGDWKCHAGPAVIRLWPDSLDLIHELSSHRAKRVHKATDKRNVDMCGAIPDSCRLAAIYVLERIDSQRGTIEIHPFGAAEAAVRLVQHSLAGGPSSALGLASGRFVRLAALASDVPVRLLRYSSDPHLFDRLFRSIERDAALSCQGYAGAGAGGVATRGDFPGVDNSGSLGASK